MDKVYWTKSDAVQAAEARDGPFVARRPTTSVVSLAPGPREAAARSFLEPTKNTSGKSKEISMKKMTNWAWYNDSISLNPTETAGSLNSWYDGINVIGQAHHFHPLQQDDGCYCRQATGKTKTLLEAPKVTWTDR
jgi:hypothetical protein